MVDVKRSRIQPKLAPRVRTLLRSGSQDPGILRQLPCGPERRDRAKTEAHERDPPGLRAALKLPCGIQGVPAPSLHAPILEVALGVATADGVESQRSVGSDRSR